MGIGKGVVLLFTITTGGEGREAFVLYLVLFIFGYMLPITALKCIIYSAYLGFPPLIISLWGTFSYIFEIWSLDII
jgi:hypothetical protein